MTKTRIMTGGLIAGLILSLFSCIDNSYDLTKEIDMKVNLGKNLTLPIGKTDTIRLNRMITEGDVLHAVDGRYVIFKSDSITESFRAIDDMIIDDFSPEFKVYNTSFEEVYGEKIPDIPGLEIPDITVKFDAEINMVDSFDIHVDIPKEVKEIKYVQVTDYNYRDVDVILHLDVEGIPTTIPVVHVAGCELKLPSVIDFEVTENETLIRKESSIYFTRDITLVNGQGELAIPMKIKGFLAPEVRDGELILNDEVKFSGKVYVDETKVSAEEILHGKPIQIIPRITLPTPQMRVTEVAGTIEPTVDLNTSVSLADLPDFLRREGTSLGVKDLSLDLSIENPIGAPILANILLTPKDSLGNIVNNNQVELVFEIPDGQRSDFHINKSSSAIVSGSLTDLLTTIPDRIDLSVSRIAAKSESQSQTIELGNQNYQLDINYNLEVPLEFDELKIEYTETVKDLQKDLEDWSDMVNHLTLHTVIDNAIPLGLTLNVKPLNASGQKISGLEFPESLRVEAAADANGTVRSTVLDIELFETRDGALNELDRLDLVVEGTNVKGQEVILRPDQFIVIHLSVKLPDGIQVDLNDL